VRELAYRSVTLAGLLDFYLLLGRCSHELPLDDSAAPPSLGAKVAELWGQGLMPHFDPERSTTNDVVRHAVIPASRCRGAPGGGGRALAELLEDGAPMGQQGTLRMVTHNWGNVFAHLLAAVVADGLGVRRWGDVAARLSAPSWEERRREVRALQAELSKAGTLWQRYWVCTFCVNQHASICHSPSACADAVTGQPLPLCDCSEPKFLNDSPVLCELNKFDEMMGLMISEFDDFVHVVAVDHNFDLLARAWCIAELVEGHASNVEQHVQIHSSEALEQNYREMVPVRVQDCEASREEDKREILARIGSQEDIEQFNTSLQNLLYGRNGLLNAWLSGEYRSRGVGVAVARVLARLQAAGVEEVGKLAKAPDEECCSVRVDGAALPD